MTPTDVKLVQAIESMIGGELKELEVDDKAVEEIILQVGVTKREQVTFKLLATRQVSSAADSKCLGLVVKWSAWLLVPFLATTNYFSFVASSN